MNFGYLIVVATSAEHNYAQLAYALALSIKNTQKPGYDKVALVIDDKSQIENFNSPWVFDEIIEWDKKGHWDGRSYMDELSPWEHTVCLDADMLFFRDYSHWIDYFIKNSELYIANTAYTYRGELVTSDIYRRTFTKNSLPNLYSFFTFFKKDSILAAEFFMLQRSIMDNPNEYINMFLKKHTPKVIGTDEAFSIAAKILDITDEIAYPMQFPRVVHLKGGVQNWPWPANKATDHVGYYLNDKGKLKIGSYQQNDIVHYVEKDKVTLETINVLEELVWKS